jgi:BirA family biotin operon repressor/biotin-[acetyl-CoA-carboxylase] ligase
MEYQIIHIDETDSTNRWLKENGGEAAMVVVAEYQTAGKGCGKNSWESERGKNLTFSMLVHPSERPLRIQAKEQFRITEVVSVALCKTLQPYIYNKVEIKWPNDIYVGDQKICGVLIENRLQGSDIKDSIIGIGLNVNQTAFVSNAPNPVSLYQLTKLKTDLDELLIRFLTEFDSAYQCVTTPIAYRQRLYRKGKEGLYKDGNGVFTAKLENVFSDGRLLLVDQDGRDRVYAFKEVQFII